MPFIKYFESTDAGAPTLNNAVGSMIAVLDACLITGYNTNSVTSITVAGGVATVVCTAHGYSNGYGKIIRHAGASDALLNIDARIDNVTTNGYTYLCPGAADGVATGTITAKYAPLDWVKQYTGTNKAMYKRSDVTATGCMLRIDDNVVGQSCRALMVHSATDIDTYVNPSPNAALIADGLGQYWSKGYNNATPAAWLAVADDKKFFLFVASTVGATSYLLHAFGDEIDFKPGSVLGCVIGGPGASSAATGSYAYYGNSAANTPASLVIAGGKNGITTSQFLNTEVKNAGYGVGGPVYPSDVDGGLVIAYPVLLNEAALDGHRRAVAAGLAIPLANISASLPSKTKISNIIGSNRVFLVVQVASGAGGGTFYVPLIDLTGPWRE